MSKTRVFLRKKKKKQVMGNVKGKFKERKLVLVLVTPISKTSQTPFTISI